MNGIAADFEEDAVSNVYAFEARDEAVEDATPDDEDDDTPKDRPTLLAELRSVGDRVDAIDPRVLEQETAPRDQLVRELDLALGAALDVLGALQRDDEPSRLRADASGVARRPSGEFMLAFAEDEGEDAPPTRVHILTPPRLANICFAGSFELARVRRDLAAARGLPDVIIAAETARRKVLRACRAVLDATDDTVQHEPTWRREVSLLREGLAVRRLYATFRRSLRRATSEEPEAVLTAVRYAAGGLATIVGSPTYADVRASDRALLRQLHQRALEWARGDRGVVSGMRLLDDVWTCADLLRDINRRQELRAHDVAAIRAVLNGPTDTVGWVAQLDALIGIDDKLDALIVRASSTPLDTALTTELLERLDLFR